MFHNSSLLTRKHGRRRINFEESWTVERLGFVTLNCLHGRYFFFFFFSLWPNRLNFRTLLSLNFCFYLLYYIREVFKIFIQFFKKKFSYLQCEGKIQILNISSEIPQVSKGLSTIRFLAWGNIFQFKSLSEGTQHT